MTFYRDMCSKYNVKLYISECEGVPGEIIYEDEFQIAAKGDAGEVKITTRELE